MDSYSKNLKPIFTAANDRGIGSEGLEQGGPDLGHDYSRPVGTRGDTGARDAVIVPHDDKKTETHDTLNMDTESSRDLTDEVPEYEDDFDEEDEDTDDDMMEDEVLQGLDDDDDDDDDDE